jgi:drug/metabolite transporter (DMT)-like permease
VTRKSLLLFAAASVIWGSSFLFIRVAVEHIPAAVVVFGRTALGAAFLVPLDARRRAFPRAAPGDRAHCRRDPAGHEAARRLGATFRRPVSRRIGG